MSLIKCPECGREISDLANVCIHCGFPLEYLKNTECNTYRIYINQVEKDNNIQIPLSNLLIELLRCDFITTLCVMKEAPTILFQHLSQEKAQEIYDRISSITSAVHIEREDVISKMHTVEDIIAQREAKKPKCPHCNSTNIRKIGTGKRLVHGAAFGLFSKTARSQWECRRCGNKW